MLWHHRKRNLRRSWTFCPNMYVCGCRGGICDGDNHCNPECSGRISCLLGVHCGWHRSPYLTGLQLKTCYTVSDCSLPPIFHLSSLLSHWHTLTCTCTDTHTHTHTDCFYSPITRLLAATTVICVLCPLWEDDLCLMVKITGLSTFFHCNHCLRVKRKEACTSARFETLKAFRGDLVPLICCFVCLS